MSSGGRRRAGAPAGPGSPRAAPDAARMVAVEVVRRVTDGAFLAPTLSRALDRAALAGPQRALATDVAYGTVRHLPHVDAMLAPWLRAPERLPAATRAALRAACYELGWRATPRHAAVDAYVEVVKASAPRLAGLANAVLRRVDPAAPVEEGTRLALPAWLLTRFEEALGPERARAAALGMLDPEPLWLSTFRDDADALLRDAGCEVDDGPLPRTLRVRPRAPLATLAPYRDGAVQPQNPSATVPVAALGDVRGRRVLDLAAGGGVKTALLARDGAVVTAVDRDAARLKAAATNLARLGLHSEAVRHDLRDAPAVAPADRVLLDAPCTGTGTLRGHPEIKLRIGPDDVDAAAALQAQLLDTAARLTAPGGVLVYAVCSLTEAEGEAQARALLRRHPDLTAEAWTTPLAAVDRPLGRYLLPLEGLDGFYVARFRRA